MGVDEQNYYTPDGYVDLPGAYVFDASGLTNGTEVQNNVIPIEYDSIFVLRAVLGVPNCIDPSTGGFRLNNYSKSRIMGGYIKPFANNVPVVPEVIYPPNSQISFDLFNVQKAVNSCATNIPISNIMFQGVKRYRPGVPGYNGPAFPIPYDPLNYIERPWSYPLDFDLSWFHWNSSGSAAGIIDIPRTFVVEVQDYDFQLHCIKISDSTTGLALTPDLFSIQLFDATAKRALFGSPVNQSYINNTRNAFSNPVFPVPPLLYPVWTQIRVDITSLVCNEDVSSPYHLQIEFQGLQRIPRVTSLPGTADNTSAAPPQSQNPSNAGRLPGITGPDEGEGY